MNNRNDSADIGDNTTAVVIVGLTLGLPLLFLGWIVKQAINLPPTPELLLASLRITETSQSEISHTLELKG